MLIIGSPSGVSSAVLYQVRMGCGDAMNSSMRVVAAPLNTLVA